MVKVNTDMSLYLIRLTATKAHRGAEVQAPVTLLPVGFE